MRVRGTIRLKDGREYYRLDEAEGREFGAYDVYLYELVLLFFGLGPEEPIIGRATLMEGLYEFSEELKGRGYMVQDPHFVPLGDKHYSKLLDRVLDDLWWSGFVEVVAENGTEEFRLTEKGEERAKALVKEKLRLGDLDYFKALRLSLSRPAGTKG